MFKNRFICIMTSNIKCSWRSCYIVNIMWSSHNPLKLCRGSQWKLEQFSPFALVFLFFSEEIMRQLRFHSTYVFGVHIVQIHRVCLWMVRDNILNNMNVNMVSYHQIAYYKVRVKRLHANTFSHICPTITTHGFILWFHDVEHVDDWNVVWTI